MENLTNLDASLQKRCFQLIRTIEEILPQKVESTEISDLSADLNRFKKKLFGMRASNDEIVRSYQTLKYRFQALTASGKIKSKPEPIGLQMATVDQILPVNLKWQEFPGDCEFLIETAELEENQMPVWREYIKTTSNRLTIRDLQKGKTYWFRISKISKVGM